MVREFCSRLMNGWKKVGMFIGDTIARVALLFVFWFSVVPIHMIWVMIKKDPMNRLWDQDKDSYFDPPDQMDPEHWQRMF